MYQFWQDIVLWPAIILSPVVTWLSLTKTFLFDIFSRAAPKNEDEMMVAIFEYIDR